ncbi:ion transporter [Catalinimonas alkaloidigena]|uniref:ion transporter n=1 Tax=Catalinimonas alkaloidigena TaxID=1075417 RepID=UPI001FE076C2|nr:ion transporter [Catalinimonas alkaloidigena]
MLEKERIRQPWRLRLHEIIFESDTPAGKAFDVVLLILILFSILIVMLESVDSVARRHGEMLRLVEWIVTLLFTIEYGLRILSAGRASRYLFSFFGIIDLLSILPTYLSLVIVGSQYLLVIRGLRLLRVFRVLKLSRYMGEAQILTLALRQSVAKITVFIGTVVILVIIMGAAMYLIEGPENGFRNIPISIYWAVVTLTTVGYGDIAPQTTAGQLLATLLMIMGYGIIAVPTGIVSVELNKAERKPTDRDAASGQQADAAGTSPGPMDLERAVHSACRVERVWFDAERIHFVLHDGRDVGIPFAWYPTLQHAEPQQRERWKLLAKGALVHWPGLDVDILITEVLK